MPPIGQGVLACQTYTQVDAMVDLDDRFTLNYTNTKSCCDDDPRMYPVPAVKEGDWTVGKYLSGALKKAGDAKAALWCMSDIIIHNVRNLMIRWQPIRNYRDYDEEAGAGVDRGTPEEYNRYKDMVIQFRTALGPEFAPTAGNVLGHLSVGRHANDIAQMILEMSEGKSTKKKDPTYIPAISAGVPHDLETDEIIEPAKKLNGRKVRKLALALKVDRDLRIRADAFVADVQTRLEAVPPAAVTVVGQANAAILRECIELAEAFEDGQAIRGQEANIDPLFMTFYQLFVVMKSSEVQAKNLMRVLWKVNQQCAGRKEKAAALQSYVSLGGDRFAGFLVKNGSIYLPPWVVTYRRVEEMAAVAMFDRANISASVSAPAVSWRFFFNLKTNGTQKAQIITQINVLEKEQKTKVSEHMLHQVLVGRAGSCECTINREGNALNCTITM